MSEEKANYKGKPVKDNGQQYKPYGKPQHTIPGKRYHNSGRDYAPQINPNNIAIGNKNPIDEALANLQDRDDGYHCMFDGQIFHSEEEFINHLHNDHEYEMEELNNGIREENGVGLNVIDAANEGYDSNSGVAVCIYDGKAFDSNNQEQNYSNLVQHLKTEHTDLFKEQPPTLLPQGTLGRRNNGGLSHKLEYYIMRPRRATSHNYSGKPAEMKRRKRFDAGKMHGALSRTPPIQGLKNGEVKEHLIAFKYADFVKGLGAYRMAGIDEYLAKKMYNEYDLYLGNLEVLFNLYRDTIYRAQVSKVH